jgi:hypothetical protein
VKRESDSEKGWGLETRGKWATVFFLNGIGDAVLYLPAVRALADLFEGRLSIAFAPIKAAFLFESIHANKVPIEAWYKPPAAPSFDAGMVARAIGSTDIFVSLVNWESEDLAELVSRLRPSVSIGRGPLFQHQLRWSPNRHTVDSTFDAVKVFAPSAVIEDFWGLPPMPHLRRIDASVVRDAFPKCNETLAVHLDTKIGKTWSAARVAQMLERFLAGHPNTVAFLVGMECKLDSSLLDNERIVSCLGLPLATTMCLLDYADLFVGVDSCFLHAADLMRIPGVGLFAPRSARQWGFRIGPGVSIEARHSVCAIQPELVASALDTLFEQRSYSDYRYRVPL